MTDLLLTLAVSTLVRATALAAAVALVLAVFRIRSSRTRHTAWVAVLVVMLLMPVLTRIVPPIRVPVPERPVGLRAEPPLAPGPVRRIDTPLPALPASMSPDGATAPPIAAPGLEQNTRPDAPNVPVRWDGIVLAGYLAGLAFFLVRFAIGLTQLARIRRGSRPVSTTDGDVAWESAIVATPVTIGVIAPRVILPVAWHEWPAEMLTAVLAHERAHCTRRDPLIATLARLNTAIFWFHPLAWWLERTVATLAEHVCDDAALQHVERRRYAETLLDIAATVRRNNGRLAWQGVGVDGDGRLGQRIDRVLSGRPWPEASFTRRALVAASCAVTIAVAIACQQEVKVEPLREDPELAAKLKADSDRRASYRAAQEMTLDQAAALEKTLEKNPEDTATRTKLLNFYRWTGKNTQPWTENVAARRRHALWLVEHHPESPLVLQVAVTKSTDAAGYAQLRKRWLTLTARADADPKVISNAVWFFALPTSHPARREGDSDIRKAEELILRARKNAREPDAPPLAVPIVPSNLRSAGDAAVLSGRLGELYASALRPPPGEVAEPSLAAWARQRLDESTDAAVLLTAGEHLFHGPQSRELGRSFVERASRMNTPAAQRAREWLRIIDSSRDPALAFNRAPRSEWPGILAKSTGLRKLRQLTAIATGEYGMAEYYDWRAKQPAGSGNTSPDQNEDQRLAAEGFASATKYGRQAIDLAPSLTGDGVGEVAFGARIAYGLALLHEGERKGAVEQLLEAAKLPPPAGVAIGRWASGSEYKLVFYLLKNGERQTIIDYFERAAQGRDEARRKVMLASAAAIRDGRMPEHYQYLLAHGGL